MPDRVETESRKLLGKLRTAMAVEERARQALQQQKEPIAGRMKELEELITRREGEVQSFRERRFDVRQNHGLVYLINDLRRGA